MKIRKLESYTERPKPDDYDKDMAQKSRIAGTAIIFDLVNSTKLKISKQFPNWIEDYTPFYNFVAKPFVDKGIWNKFLGDAFFFFIPDKDGYNKGKKFEPELGYLSYSEIYDNCKKIMENYWNHYEIYREKNIKGGEKHINFREITCALDYGNEVFNWHHLLKEKEDEEPKFDPIGKTIDRCFRFSALAGAGQIVTSSYFYNRLISKKKELKDNFINIHVKKETLKGFPDITDVYYDRPRKEKIDYYLDNNSVELIENARPMDIKAKLKLFREKISALENSDS